MVHEFATVYFDLPHNHTSIIGDATEVVNDMQSSKTGKKYDYIIHDVFTGGAEPIELFTLEFLTDLSNLLTGNGVIAIVGWSTTRLPCVSC
jgi:spermidine synthase